MCSNSAASSVSVLKEPSEVVTERQGEGALWAGFCMVSVLKEPNEVVTERQGDGGNESG